MASSSSRQRRAGRGPLAMAQPLSRGHRVEISAICASGERSSVDFSRQEGLVVCSSYCHMLDDVVRESLRSSAGAVVRQMRHAGVDLRPAVTRLQKQLRQRLIDCSSPKLEILWQRSRDTPGVVECDAIVLALLPESWKTFDNLSQEQQQEQQDEQWELQQLQYLYGDIRDMIKRFRCEVICMPTIGKSNLFPAAVVMREVAALASYCDGMIPSVHKLVICTPNDSTLNVYRSLFEGPEWRAVMKESQVFETCRQIQSLVDWATQQQTQHTIVSAVLTRVQRLLNFVARVSRGHFADPRLESNMQRLSINSSHSNYRTPSYLDDITDHCCREGRVVVEMLLKKMIHASDADWKLCEQQWKQVQRQRRQNIDLDMAMVGDLMTVIRRAVKEVTQRRGARAGPGLSLWSQQLKDACRTLQQVGNRASHCTVSGEIDVTVADTNMSLWSLKQLIEALINV